VSPWARRNSRRLPHALFDKRLGWALRGWVPTENKLDILLSAFEAVFIELVNTTQTNPQSKLLKTNSMSRPNTQSSEASRKQGQMPEETVTLVPLRRSMHAQSESGENLRQFW